MSNPTQSSLHLTPRDVAVLEMVYRYNGCTIQHLHRRFWPQDSSLAACYRRVARLVKDRYLVANRLPSTSAHGSGKAFLTIGVRGRQIIAEQRGIPSRQLPYQGHMAGLLFVQHHCAICDVRLALEAAAEQQAGVTLVEWIAEAQLKKAPMRVSDTYTVNGTEESRTITVIPDGAFTLLAGKRQQQGFLEMDMGTLPPKRLHLKIRGYVRMHATTPVPIFFVTLTERRANQIVRMAQAVAEELRGDPTLFFVTIANQITAATVLTTPIWQQVGVAHPVAILPTRPAQTMLASDMGISTQVTAASAGRER